MTEPCGLPRGTVRAALTLLLVGAAIATCFVPVDGGARETLLALAGIACRDYFGHRSVQNREDGPSLAPPSPNEPS